MTRHSQTHTHNIQTIIIITAKVESLLSELFHLRYKISALRFSVSLFLFLLKSPFGERKRHTQQKTGCQLRIIHSILILFLQYSLSQLSYLLIFSSFAFFPFSSSFYLILLHFLFLLFHFILSSLII